MTTRLLTQILLAGLALSPLCTAEPVDPPPTPPFVAKAPSPGAWTITVTSKRKDPTAAVQPPPTSYEISVAKSGSRRREVTAFPNGSGMEVFTVNGLSFIRRSSFAPGDVLVQPAQNSNIDFPEFDWLDLGNYIGTKKDKGKKFHVFAYSPAVVEPNYSGPNKVVEPARPGLAEDRLNITAWIDAETGLPARIASQVGEQTYKFSDSPGSKLAPSPDIRKRVEAYFEGKIPE